MTSETRNDILSIARVLEKQAERCRMQRAYALKDAYEKKGSEIETTALATTLGYVGALSSILASTLCEIVEKDSRKDLFSVETTNCVLREWGLDELV